MTSTTSPSEPEGYDPETQEAFDRLTAARRAGLLPPLVVNGKTGDVYEDDRWDADPPTDADRATYRFLTQVKTPEQVKALPPPTWLLEGYLVEDTLAMLWGEWNAGKSFLALSWAGYIGTGSWWMNNRSSKTKVLYVAAEGLNGFGPRIKAFEARHRIHMAGVEFFGHAINLANADEVSGLIDMTSEKGIGLIVWDTLARMIPGIEENSAKEVGLVVASLDRLREAGCGSLVIHHSSKGGDAARGVSAFLGACDTELRLKASDQELTLQVVQQRDWQRRDDLRLWLEPVGGTNSATVVDGVGKVTSSALAPAEQEVLDVLSKLPAGHYTIKEISGVGASPEKTIEKAIYRLLAKGTLLRSPRGGGYEYWPAVQAVLTRSPSSPSAPHVT